MTGIIAGRRSVRAGCIAGLLAFLACAAAPRGAAADFDFHPPAVPDDPAAAAIMRDLAQRILPVYQEPDPDLYLDNLSALQIVAGDFAAAYGTRQSLRNRRSGADDAGPVGREVTYDVYAYAKAKQAAYRLAFADAFAAAFNELVPRLADEDAYSAVTWMHRSAQASRSALQQALGQDRAVDRIGQREAVDLIWKYLSFEAYRDFGSLVDPLDAADDRRRYVTDDQVLVRTRDGATIAAVVIRPKSAAKPLPALLEFTIYDSPGYARECAAHGYAGVVAYVRGVHLGGRRNPGRIVPFQHDGEDARSVIDWIAKQPWSDGRVGMYGDGYSGFTPWAAATHPPRALKAIATSASTAPGIDFPMAGGIFRNEALRWSSQLIGAAVAPDPAQDPSRWRSLDQEWYRSGRAYRDLGHLSGRPDPIFTRWLNHPSYDRFWQSMVPNREQFARLNIPVLTMTGYFAAAEAGALYYFSEHHRYNPHASHTLLMGPYDDGVMQNGPSAVLNGYHVDAAALIDLRELRYRWFDHVFRAAALPPLLQEPVNYEVMGANEWRHAASLPVVAGGSIRFHLQGAAGGDAQRLSATPDRRAAPGAQELDFRERSDAGWTAPIDLVGRSADLHNALQFVSEPLAKPVELSGLFSGRLDFTVNKMDVDLNIALYERLANGDYLRLFEPACEIRASYARDRIHRHLLKSGERQQLAFTSERLTSRRLQAGSRLVMVLGINKRPDREINYGSGEDVSAESIANAGSALIIRWYGDSYLDIPVHK